MDDYFSSQHSTFVGLPSLYMPSHKNKMASQLMDTLDESGLYPNLDMHPGFADMSMPHSDSGILMPTLTSIEPDLYHITSAPHSAMPSSVPPTESDYDSPIGGQARDGQGSQKNVTRRQQNRDAQRRYRERQSKQTKSLEQNVVDLEARCQWLSNSFYLKSHEVMQLFRDNGALKSEVQSLHQRWQLMIMLLQRPRALQSLSVLLAEAVKCLEGFAPPIEPASLDEFLRSLDSMLTADGDLNRGS
ncbi:hypothetical protein BJY00DRAFT_315966 [Aspergillus carlsbadensis]|nr:hypothetical protein BJY00DRAFT_315966 [Aspergillus carlsbadensis]